jgi:hypothetical protein
MQIKVMPFLSKKGNRVAKGAIEFDGAFDPQNNVLAGFQFVGFTICDDKEKGLFVLFPSSTVTREGNTKPYFFLRPSEDKMLDRLQDAILDVYESMIAHSTSSINRPRMNAPAVVAAKVDE